MSIAEDLVYGRIKNFFAFGMLVLHCPKHRFLEYFGCSYDLLAVLRQLWNLI